MSAEKTGIGPLKFKCQNSGKCCVSRGEVGFVFLTQKDVFRLSVFLNKPVSDFAKQSLFDYTRFKKGRSLQWHLTNSEGPCQFLKNKKCSIYEARPQQCRSWPFYPEHMTPKAWAETAKFCPGIGKGPELSQDEVSKIIGDQEKADWGMSYGEEKDQN